MIVSECRGFVDPCQSGRSAEGVAVELSDVGASRVSSRTFTNADGRTDQPLIYHRPVPIGCYELTFSVGGYLPDRKQHIRSAVSLPNSPALFS
jgi:2-oxo-4-hydroxy-4-carboxy-5-ureidoimidazoline decarboxylase